MKKFEYQTRYFGSHEMPRGWDNYLNQMGDEGWELVHIVINKMINAPDCDSNYRFVFKKELTLQNK